MKTLTPMTLMGTMMKDKIRFITRQLILGMMMFFISYFLLSCKSKGDGLVTSDMIHITATASSEKQDYKGPKMTFDQDTLLFGPIAVGERISHVFQFVNSGKSPLIISGVYPSCGCTTLKDWPKDPIAPGASGQISIDFNSTGNSGKVDKTITVSTNAEPTNIVLHLIGDVVGKEIYQSNQRSGVHMERTR
jgi:hypothetical protein